MIFKLNRLIATGKAVLNGQNTILSSLITDVRYFNSSAKLEAGKLWRQSVGLSKLQTARGPLIDLPDYSYVDGRPVPPTLGQMKRKELQKKLATDIVSGLNYLNEAKGIIKSKHDSVPDLMPYIDKSQQTHGKEKNQDKVRKSRSKKPNQ